MKKVFTKEVIIGLVSIVSLVVLVFGVNYLKGINLFKPTNNYYISMPNVAELQTSSPVFADGFKVGIVNSIDYGFDKSPTDPIVVQISLDKKMRVQKGSYAELKVGLTSGAFLNLMLNKYVGEYCQIGDTIDGRTSLALIDQLSDKILPRVETMLPHLDSILIGLQTLINHPALTQSLEHIEATTSNLQKSSVQLNAMLSKDIPLIVENLKGVSSDFAIVSSRLKDIDLQPTITKVDLAIENIDKMSNQLNSQDNSLGLLLNDRSLYQNLDSTARNASILLKDVKDHPKRYVHFSLF
jgi:phospholipid/cholesterol/gamma-HCH transport system substrate-binding protein